MDLDRRLRKSETSGGVDDGDDLSDLSGLRPRRSNGIDVIRRGFWLFVDKGLASSDSWVGTTKDGGSIRCAILDTAFVLLGSSISFKYDDDRSLHF